MTPEEGKMVQAIQNAFYPVFQSECLKRCPDNRGYEPKCEFCDVQHSFLEIQDSFKLAAEKCGPFLAARCLIENEHRYSRYPEGWMA